jgi:DNA replication and repair protein RecF
VQVGSISRDIRVWIGPGKKRLFLYGKNVGIEEFVGNFHVLVFAQEHLNVARGGPSERRAFLDRAMVTLYPGHMRHLAAYGRALKQRNSVLASAKIGGNRSDCDLLESWDEALAREGACIICNRTRYVEKIKKELPSGFLGPEEFKIHYLSTASRESSDIPEIETEFRKKLLLSRPLDERLGFTSVGPHRDDLKLFLNGKSLVNFASAGQQRSGLLCLYLAQMEIHKREHGFYPVFLLDDFEAELDDQRLRKFLEYLRGKTQVLLTTAKTSQAAAINGEMNRFDVHAGLARACR